MRHVVREQKGSAETAYFGNASDEFNTVLVPATHVCTEAEMNFAAFAKRVARFGLAGKPGMRTNSSFRGFSAPPTKLRSLR